MYLRWKKYTTDKRGPVLRAELLESYRDEVTGKPRSRYLGYLGSIQESYVSNWLTQLCFWECAEIRLARLSLSPENKERVREMLLERVPQPKRGEASILARFSRHVA
jgi:hypothetical protein